MADERTTINVKGVAVRAWNRARPLAQRDGEAMGAWLTRAIDQLADREEAGPRELPPIAGIAQNQPAQISPPTAPDLQTLMQGAAALANAGALSRVGRSAVNRLVANAALAVQGLPPEPVKTKAIPANKIRKVGNPPEQ